MENATEILISQIFEKKEDTMICLAVADHNVKVGDIFTTRYQVPREDIINDVIPRRNINVKSISIRVVKIIIDRKGTEVAQLDTSIEDGAIFHLQGDIDDLYLFIYILTMSSSEKPLEWIGSSYKDLLALPDDVRRHFGFALSLAQAGDKHDDAKVLKGFGGAGVLEVVEDDAGGTYRAVYTVKFAEAVFVLHCFQKKSKRGIATPKEDMDIVHARLKIAEAYVKELRK